jgi:hypothetical protein
MRALSGMRLSGLLLVLASCDTPVEVDTFILYRNSSMESRARVHFATFGADESASTYNNRRVATGTQAAMVAGAAMASPVSRTWKGYWQRAA